MADDKGGSPVENWHIVVAFIALLGLFGYLYYYVNYQQTGTLNGNQKRSLNDVLGIPISTSPSASPTGTHSIFP